MKASKTGGRAKGTPNKVTSDIRKVLASVWDNYSAGQLHSDLEALEPVKRVQIMTKLLSFVAPRMQTIEYRDMTEEQPTIIIEKEVIGRCIECNSKFNSINDIR